MRKLAVAIFVIFQSLPCLSAEVTPFQIIYRQENIATDKFITRSDLWITAINLSGGEVSDVAVSISGPNPYLFVDSAVPISNIPDGRQVEILHPSRMPNDIVALSDPEEEIVWRIEYTDATGGRVSLEIKGVKGF